MTKKMVAIALLISVALLGVTGFAGASSSVKIGVVVKTLANEFWQEMVDGYTDAANRYGIQIEVGSVPTEANVVEQLAVLETFLAKDYDAVCISPMTTLNLIPGIVEANRLGVPVVAVDEQPDPDELRAAGGYITSLVRANPYEPGIVAADWMIDNLKGGKVLAIDGLPGTGGIRRGDGFEETIAKAPSFQLVSRQPANWDRVQALNVATNVLEAHPDLVGIYCANDTMALGALEAVRAAGLEGKIAVIGTDAIPEALEAIEKGQLTGTVAQYPYEMGWLAIEQAMKAVEKRPVPKTIDAPVALITK
jgi:ABC-type sugar transport system substrate-binding protein